MKKIFLSYRRDDTPVDAARIYDSLTRRFGRRAVVRDVVSFMKEGDFRKEIPKHLEGCAVMLVVIGGRWLSILRERQQDAGKTDWVQVEIDTAHSHNIPVILVVVGDARKPTSADMEGLEVLQWLPYLSRELRINHDEQYEDNVRQLVREIQRLRRATVGRRLALAGAALAMAAGLALGSAGAGAWDRSPGDPVMGPARTLGLVGIDDRNDAVRAVPPEKFFREANREVLVSGVTCYRTIDIHQDLINDLLELNRDLYFLIVDPDSPDMKRLTEQHRKEIDKEVRQVISIVKLNNYHRNKLFHLRLAPKLPPFTAVMIDGDVSGTASPPRDRKGRIRVQPGVAYGSQHKGIVFTFVKRTEESLGGYDLFAQDLRRQWAAASDSDAKLKAMFDAP